MPVPIGATTLELDCFATLELDVIAAEELDSTLVSELVVVSELLGKTSSELLAMSVSLLEGGTPSQLLEDCTSQLQVVFPVGALMFSLTQAASANARSDTAESPLAMLVNFFFMIPLFFILLRLNP